jgi:hypothetical protein
MGVFKGSTRGAYSHSEHQGTALDHPDSAVSLAILYSVPVLRVRNKIVLKYLTVNTVLTTFGQRKFTTVDKVHCVLPALIMKLLVEISTFYFHIKMKMCIYNKFSETVYTIDSRCQQYSITSSFEVHSPAICYGLVYIFKKVYIFILSHSATQ